MNDTNTSTNTNNVPYTPGSGQPMTTYSADNGYTTTTPSAIPVDSLNKTMTPPTLPSAPSSPDYTSLISSSVPPPPTPTPNNPTPATDTSTSLLGKVSALMGLDGGKAAYTQDQLDKSGATALIARQNTLQGKLQSLNDKAQGIPTQTAKTFTGSGATTGGIAPLTHAALADNALEALSLKSEYDLNAGDLVNAKDTAQKAIDMVYKPIEDAIANNTALLKLYEPFMSAEQKAQSDKIQEQNQAKVTALADAKKQQQDVVNAAQAAASKGIAGASDAAAAALKLDPNSSTFSNDLAKIQAGIPATPEKDSYQVVKGSTDAFGNPLPDRIFNSTTGKFVSGGSGNTHIADTTPTNGVPIIGSGGVGTGTASGKQLSFDQYGLLANTDFNPSNMVDQLSQKYLDQYIKNGSVPTASSLGRSMKPEAIAQVDSRARDLYFKATGNALPSPQIIKGYQQIIDSNNKLANNLQIQEQTVKSNVDLSLANMKKNDLNSIGFKPLDSFINSVNDMLNDPATGQLIAQNKTIQGELGSLLAVKNSSGTTVYDKLSSAGIIDKNDNEAQVKIKLTTLLNEASNFADSLKMANAGLYKQVDPFLQDPNNPARAQIKVETALNKVGANYTDVISKTPSGQIPVLDKSGNVGYITPGEFNSLYYTKL